MLSTRRLALSAFLGSATLSAALACSGSDDSGLAGGGASDAGADSSASGGGSGSGDAGTGGTGGAGTGGGATGGAGGAGTGGAGGSSGGSTSATPCTADGDCTSAATPRCDLRGSRTCVACLFDNECGEAERCDAGACVAVPTCANSRDCRNDAGDPRTICDPATQRCVECAADTDCGDATESCASGTCVASSACAGDDDCLADGGDPSRPVCGRGGTCVACRADTDCGAGQACVGSACRPACDSDNDCQVGDQLCDLAEGACVDCKVHGDCDALDHCADGACVPDVCAQGVKSCIGGAVLECNASGSDVLAPVVCAEGTECVAAGGTASCEIPRLPDGGLPPPAECTDGQTNGDETDQDCGGSCAKCGTGATCDSGADCESGNCQASCSGPLCLPGTRDKTCRSASCRDGVKNGEESDQDCGGPSCAGCGLGGTCGADDDCESGLCDAGVCIARACSANLCASCPLPTQSACCRANGTCGCASTFPFPGPCQ